MKSRFSDGVANDVQLKVVGDGLRSYVKIRLYLKKGCSQRDRGFRNMQFSLCQSWFFVFKGGLYHVQ
jgi:hypothetical protein